MEEKKTIYMAACPYIRQGVLYNNRVVVSSCDPMFTVTDTNTNAFHGAGIYSMSRSLLDGAGREFRTVRPVRAISFELYKTIDKFVQAEAYGDGLLIATGCNLMKQKLGKVVSGSLSKAILDMVAASEFPDESVIQALQQPLFNKTLPMIVRMPEETVLVSITKAQRKHFIVFDSALAQAKMAADELWLHRAQLRNVETTQLPNGDLEFRHVPIDSRQTITVNDFACAAKLRSAE